MMKTAYAVIKGAQKDGIAKISVPRMVSQRNGATVYTEMRVVVLPSVTVKEDSPPSTFNKSVVLLSNVLDSLYSGPKAKVKALKKIATDLGVTILDRLQQMTIPEVLAFRKKCRLSGNQTSKIGSYLRQIGILNNLLPRMEIVTEYEKERQHEVSVQSMSLFVSSADKDSKNPECKPCTAWHIRRPAGILEDLVCATRLADKFQPSIDISNYQDSILVFMGNDKAADEVTNSIRDGNRKDGNHGSCCQPFARTEDGAAENSCNCGAFFYNPRYPMKSYQQHLLDDKLHMIIVEVRAPDGKLIGCRATTVEFDGLPTADDADVNLYVPDDADSIIDRTVLIDEDSIPGNLDQWTKANTGVFKLAVNETGSAVGVVNEADPEALIGWRNNTTLPLDISVGEVQLVCLRLRGFLSHDTKQGLIVAGIGSPSSSCPCLCCLQHKNRFKFYPAWMRERDQTIPENQTESDEPTLRNGTNSVTEMHAKYVRDKEQNPSAIQSNARHVGIKVQHGSCVLEPGLDCHGEKDMLAPLHTSSGIFTHHSCNTRALIRKAEENNSWLRRVIEVKEEASAVVEGIKADGRRKTNHNQVMQIENDLRRALADREQAEREGGDDAIGEAQCRIEQLQQRLLYFTEQQQYVMNEKKLKGAEEMEKLITTYLKSSSRKPRGRAEYRYNQAFEVIARVFFRAEHSGFELSNADGIKALEKWAEICEYTIASYDANSEDAEEARMAQQITEIMTKSKEVSSPLLPVSKTMKSQKKLEQDTIDEFSDELIKLSKAWRTIYNTFDDNNNNSKDVFIKLHHLEAHIRPFMIKHGFYGRGSEEGMEQAHNEYEADKKITSRLKCTLQRVEAFLRRQNSAVATEIVPLMQGGKGKKRGSYQPSDKRKRRRIEKVVNSSIRNATDGYLESRRYQNQLQLPNQDFLEAGILMCAYGEVPEEWMGD